MEKNECIFCMIANGEIPSARILEDPDFVAVLDINPNTKGMTLVIPKKHYDSYVFDLDDKVANEAYKFAKKAAEMLEKGLSVQRVALVMEGMGINHLHLKLYPIIGVEEKFREMWGMERVFFEKYEGYISTELGPQAKPEDLQALAEQIKASQDK